MNNPEPFLEECVKPSKLVMEIFLTTLKYLEKERYSWEELLALKAGKISRDKKCYSPPKKDRNKQLTMGSDLSASKFDKRLSQSEVEILQHIYGQAKSLENELKTISNLEAFKSLLNTIKRYLVEGGELKGMLLDCFFVYLRIVGNNLYLQMMEY